MVLMMAAGGGYSDAEQHSQCLWGTFAHLPGMKVVVVIDLRSLVPLDRAAILSSVAKTGRLLIVDEDYQSFGMSGEVAATVAETDPGLLRVPVRRVAVPDVPIPYARSLERAVLPGPDRILQAARELTRV
jgi:acetoin:2,6-dichlorophenolindophenol oxidoreductase subunit beta